MAAKDPSRDTHARIKELCQSNSSISSAYEQDPTHSPGSIAEKLYGTHHLANPTGSPVPHEQDQSSSTCLEWARSCGNFGNTTPSPLFLQAFHDLLQPLAHDPLANCVSPPLCGSTGFVPMTIIAPGHDQFRHMSNLIARAKREVLFASNFWKYGMASQLINDALIELSRRAGARGERVVVKLMYDRGAFKQVFENHQNVPPAGWQAAQVGLPAPEMIPNLDFAVVNFHRPPVGTFHCKFMVVDRSTAIVTSTNVQDNDNLEMAAQYEGPIVDSLWETFLVSWHNALEPASPCRTSRAADVPPPTYDEFSFKNLFEPDGRFRVPEKPLDVDMPEHMPSDPHYDDTVGEEIDRMRCTLAPRGDEKHVDVVCRHLNAPTKISISPTASEKPSDLHFFPFIPVQATEPVPMAMCSRKPYASMDNGNGFVPQNEAFLSLIRNAKKSIFIQTPDLNAKPLLAALLTAVRFGVEVTYYVCLGYNDAGELLPGQGGTNEMAANSLYSQLSDTEKPLLRVFFYTAADQDHPISNSFKQRSCHIKLMMVDEQVAIQGSGNQDTQSYFHSQEVNVMIDSPTVCKAWRESIERNQNTATFGRAKEDGCWYDENGVMAKGTYGVKPGFFSFAKGMLGTLQKARGQ